MVFPNTWFIYKSIDIIFELFLSFKDIVKFVFIAVTVGSLLEVVVDRKVLINLYEYSM